MPDDAPRNVKALSLLGRRPCQLAFILGDTDALSAPKQGASATSAESEH